MLFPGDVRIVVADDNHDAATMLERLLAVRGFRVVGLAFDGQSALDLILQERPNVAFLDIGMAPITGYEVARRVREQHPVRPHLIAVTWWGREADRQAALDAGFDVHLVKPISIETIESVLRQILASP